LRGFVFDLRKAELNFGLFSYDFSLLLSNHFSISGTTDEQSSTCHTR